MKSLLLSTVLVLATLGAAYAQEDSGIKFNVGGGGSFLLNTIDEQYHGNYPDEDNYTSASFGFNGFVDISQYFTVKLGLRGAAGTIVHTYTSNGMVRNTDTWSNSVSQFEIAGELKYPILVNKSFSWAPKIGLDYVGYLGGSINGIAVSNLVAASDWKQLFSPIYVTLGADLNFKINKEWFIRVPMDLGFALNAKVSNAWYSPYTYDSSSSIALRGGLEVGYSI